MKSKTHNRKYLEARRKELCKNLTPAEAALWKTTSPPDLSIGSHSSLQRRKVKRVPFGMPWKLMKLKSIIETKSTPSLKREGGFNSDKN